MGEKNFGWKLNKAIITSTAHTAHQKIELMNEHQDNAHQVPLYSNHMKSMLVKIMP
jgi:hypothetical protein